MAKQKVALECLSYHATAAQDQTIKLASEPVKSAEEYKLYSFKFIGKFLKFLIGIVKIRVGFAFVQKLTRWGLRYGLQ